MLKMGEICQAGGRSRTYPLSPTFLTIGKGTKFSRLLLTVSASGKAFFAEVNHNQVSLRKGLQMTVFVSSKFVMSIGILQVCADNLMRLLNLLSQIINLLVWHG